MKVAKILGPGRIQFFDENKPVPGPKEVLVKVKYCGICGTDIAILDGDMIEVLKERRKLKKVYEIKPEIALLPINGEYGNLDSNDAAKLGADIGSKVIIPCHYWTFIEHGSYPLQLKKAAEKHAS